MADLFNHDDAGPESPTLIHQMLRALRIIEAEAGKLHQHDPFTVGRIEMHIVFVRGLLSDIGSP